MLPLDSIYKVADELTVIVYNQSDFAFAEEQAAKVQLSCKLLLHPEWSKRELVIPDIVDYVLKNPKWKASLQTNKYMNIP